MPPKQAQASSPTQAQVEVKNIITTILDAQRKKPGQQKNAEEAQKLVDAYKLPNGKTPILYAIGGKAGLATISQWGEILKKKDPNAKLWSFAWNSSLMAGSKPTEPAAKTTQSQLAAYAYFPRSQDPNACYAHEIIVEFQLPPYLGGCGTVIRRVATINDTGSNVQSLRRSDWDALNTFGLTPEPGQLLTAGGPKTVQNVYMEARVVKPEEKVNAQGVKVRTGNYVPLTIWYVELLRIVDDNETILSGEEMRNYLYFATEPGNQRLLVSERKQAIIAGLGVVQPPKP